MTTNADSEVIELNERVLEAAKLTAWAIAAPQIMAIMMLRSMGRENPDLVRGRRRGCARHS